MIRKEVGLYIQDEFFVTEKLTLSLGYRASSSKFDGTAVGDDLFMGPISAKINSSYTENAYKAGITYNYAKNSKIYASYARGYRLPTIDEVFIFNGSIVGLKPERSDTYEIGILHTFNNLMQAKLTAYTMNVHDRLFFNSNIFATENLAKTDQSGVEAGIMAPINEAVTALGNLTYSKATFSAGPNDGNTLPLIPRYSANIVADFKPTKGLLLTVIANWVDNRYLENDVTNDLKKLESYITVSSKSPVRAAAIGPSTQQVVADLLASKPLDRFHTAVRILHLADRFTAARLEAACALGLVHGDVQLGTLKRMLEAGLEAAIPIVLPTPVSEALVFARPPEELAAAITGGETWN